MASYLLFLKKLGLWLHRHLASNESHCHTCSPRSLTRILDSPRKTSRQHSQLSQVQGGIVYLPLQSGDTLQTLQLSNKELFAGAPQGRETLIHRPSAQDARHQQGYTKSARRLGVIGEHRSSRFIPSLHHTSHVLDRHGQSHHMALTSSWPDSEEVRM